MVISSVPETLASNFQSYTTEYVFILQNLSWTLPQKSRLYSAPFEQEEEKDIYWSQIIIIIITYNIYQKLFFKEDLPSITNVLSILVRNV